MDDLVLPFAERLLTCLCDALEATIGGAPCRCSLAPGTAPPPADACCNCTNGQGQATVQITDIFAVTPGKFPQRGVAGTLDNCASFEWAAELTMTVYRCVSCADDKGFPSGDELTADARKIADDAQAMRRAMLCCNWRMTDPPPGRLQGEFRPIVPGRWSPVSPLGCCAGGMMPVTVLVGPECCPPVVL